MDVNHFLKQRTAFLRGFYDAGVAPLLDTQDRIVNGVAPFDNPPWIEDEPPFMAEWSDAQTGIDLLGQTSVSVLSDSLKLYFNSLQKRVIGFVFGSDEEALLKQRGFVTAYKAALGDVLATDWTECPASFDIIEQIVLTRNLSQHGKHLSSLHLTHDARSLQGAAPPLFANETEWQSWVDSGGGDSFLMPSVTITRERLFEAIDHVEQLADWIDTQLPKADAWRERQIAAQT